MSHEDLPLMNGFPLNASESGKGLGYSLSIRSLFETVTKTVSKVKVKQMGRLFLKSMLVGKMSQMSSKTYCRL